MLSPQIIVFESESRIAPLVRELAADERWALREPRLESHCREQLQQIVPTVFVAAIEDGDERELAILADAAKLPHVAVVAVGSVDDADALAGLTWDCGADFALFPPLARDLLPEVVRGLMQRTMARLEPIVRTRD